MIFQQGEFFPFQIKYRGSSAWPEINSIWAVNCLDKVEEYLKRDAPQ
jgi:hypothetical protein